MYVPYAKDVSEKFKLTGNRYSIRIIFKSKRAPRSLLMITTPERVLHQTAQCIYCIPCEYGSSYISETGRPLAVRLREHRHSIKEGLLEKSKLAKYTYEGGHRVGWDEAKKLTQLRDYSPQANYTDRATAACRRS
jgi:hypothetical protein